MADKAEAEPKLKEPFDKQAAIEQLQQKSMDETLTKDDFTAGIEIPSEISPRLEVKQSVSDTVCKAIINGFADGVKAQWGIISFGFDVEAREEPVLEKVPLYSIIAHQAYTDVTVIVTCKTDGMRLHREAALDGVLTPLVGGLPFDKEGKVVLRLSAVKRVEYITDSKTFKIKAELRFVLQLTR